MRTSLARICIASLALAWICALASCGDALRDEATSALGPEEPGVRRGPNHRPGQPCLVCHDDAGSATPFSLAGTVYLDAPTAKAVGDVAVIFIDSAGAVFTASTNCAGNFFIRPDQFTPKYPLWVEMRAGSVHRSMESPAFREGSCAACHSDPRSPASAGHVYLIDDPTVETAPPNGCN